MVEEGRTDRLGTEAEMAGGFKVQAAEAPGAEFKDLGFAAQEHWAHTADKAAGIAQANGWAGFEQYRLVEVELPLDPEPWTEAGFLRHATRRQCYEYPVFLPREGYEQDEARYA